MFPAPRTESSSIRQPSGSLTSATTSPTVACARGSRAAWARFGYRCRSISASATSSRPSANNENYPTLLDLPAPRLWTYPPETVVAEKLHAMVEHGVRNTRVKDLWDMARLARRFAFDGEVLRNAIAETFRRRGTSFGGERPVALLPSYYEEATRERLWQELRRGMEEDADGPARLVDAGVELLRFLGPICDSLIEGECVYAGVALRRAVGAGDSGSDGEATMTERRGRVSEFRPRRFRRYPDCKDSGVVWLGEVPAHWEPKALKRLFQVVNGSTPKSSERDNWDGDIPWITPDDLGRMRERTLKHPARFITRKGYESCGTRMVGAGSLVLSTRAPIGHLAIAWYPHLHESGLPIARVPTFRQRNPCPISSSMPRDRCSKQPVEVAHSWNSRSRTSSQSSWPSRL